MRSIQLVYMYVYMVYMSCVLGWEVDFLIRIFYFLLDVFACTLYIHCTCIQYLEVCTCTCTYVQPTPTCYVFFSPSLLLTALVKKLIHEVDEDLYQFFEESECHDYLFCHRWLLLDFKREFQFQDSLRIFEARTHSLFHLVSPLSYKYTL